MAVAEGEFKQAEGKITTWLTEDPDTTMVYSSPVDDGGKLAITNYKVIDFTPASGDYPGYSLLELNLETGRTNQIRVHLRSIGHPVVGDRKYDIEGAVLAGVDSIGVLYGYGSEEELKKAGATHLAATVQDIFRIVTEA